MFYTVIRAILAFVFAVFMPIKIAGKENIPKEGAFILALNHRSNLDVVVGAVACPRHLHYMAKKELFNNKFSAWFFKKANAFPIDRKGNDLKAIKTALSILKDGKVLGIFPEGTRVKEGEDSSAKAGVSMLALRAKVPIVPGAIVGEYRLFKKVHIIFGEPVSLEQYYDTKPDSAKLLQISGEILDEIKKIDANEKKNSCKKGKNDIK